MSDETKAGGHRRRTAITFPSGHRHEAEICGRCSEPWPCEMVRLRDRVAVLEAESAHWQQANAMLANDVLRLRERLGKLKSEQDRVRGFLRIVVRDMEDESFSASTLRGMAFDLSVALTQADERQGGEGTA